jgi:acyl-CoA synthetase (AMP-forming)/AMP-acid ligase II
MHIGLAVTRIAERDPRSLALLDGARTMDCGTLDLRSNRPAQVLRGRFALASGDRVALLVRNRMEVVEVLAG